MCTVVTSPVVAHPRVGADPYFFAMFGECANDFDTGSRLRKLVRVTVS